MVAGLDVETHRPLSLPPAPSPVAGLRTATGVLAFTHPSIALTHRRMPTPYSCSWTLGRRAGRRPLSLASSMGTAEARSPSTLRATWCVTCDSEQQHYAASAPCAGPILCSLHRRSSQRLLGNSDVVSMSQSLQDYYNPEARMAVSLRMHSPSTCRYSC